MMLCGSQWASAQKGKSKKTKARKVVNKDPFKSKEVWQDIPIRRQGFHAMVDKQQKRADFIDGVGDEAVLIDGKKNHGAIISKAIFDKTDRLQIIIENLTMDDREKIFKIKELEQVLIKSNQLLEYHSNKKARVIDQMLDSYRDILEVKYKNEDLVQYVKSNANEGIYNNLFLYEENLGAKEAIYDWMVDYDPKTMVTKLREFASAPAADRLISNTAKEFPNLILSYARSTSIEREIVNRSQDTLVKTIVRMANETKKPLKALPFLNDLHSGKLSFKEVDDIVSEQSSYFKQLVKSKIGKPSIGLKMLDRELRVEALKYVRINNELHDASSAVRFKNQGPLSAADLYYLMVTCSDEIYTSSFTGTFSNMMGKMKPQAGHVFLDSLNKDKFRTFIRMCAGYNVLDQFLGTMKDDDQRNLMASFVHNIDQNKETDLADAVDVADALSSIKDSATLEFLRKEITKDYERTYKSNDKRGMTIYFILHTLAGAVLNPEDTTVDLAKILKVPPITNVTYESLADDSGTVYQQHFFYGDDDGKASFNSFLGNFPSSAWTRKDSKEWITLTSKTKDKKKIIIYANKPLEEPKDETAQENLYVYLIENNIKPSVIVHRGHSYHLPGTLKYVTPDHKIVILGSCGGYHNLSNILTASEDAHIVSSKQTGTMFVNDPLLKILNDKFTKGESVNWIKVWSTLATKVPREHKDKFDDYVPPHKNMGALFLKSFKRLTAEDEI